MHIDIMGRALAVRERSCAEGSRDIQIPSIGGFGGLIMTA